MSAALEPYGPPGGPLNKTSSCFPLPELCIFDRYPCSYFLQGFRHDREEPDLCACKPKEV